MRGRHPPWFRLELLRLEQVKCGEFPQLVEDLTGAM